MVVGWALSFMAPCEAIHPQNSDAQLNCNTGMFVGGIWYASQSSNCSSFVFVPEMLTSFVSLI